MALPSELDNSQYNLALDNNVYFNTFRDCLRTLMYVTDTNVSHIHFL